jgi:epoxyqueuosine reductase
MTRKAFFHSRNFARMASRRQNSLTFSEFSMKNGSDTTWIVPRAASLGFDLCGIVSAERFPELEKTEEWLALGFGGEMKYLADPRRSNPSTLMRGIRSVIVCALNYNSDLPRSTEAAARSDRDVPRGWISRYAWGEDYHQVSRRKLDSLTAELREHFPQTFEARVYADTGPLQERMFAKYAGLGWLGKNTLLLNTKLGSFFFLGVILTTLDIPPTIGPDDSPPPDLCGTCRRCIDACPTAAFVEPYVMDARRCISYLTIELRGSVPEEFREAMGRHVFGCDICQDVCPWNRRAPVTGAPEFRPRIVPRANGETLAEESLYLPSLEWLAAMTEEEFRQTFRGSAIKRAKWRGLVRNACIALGNSSLKRDTRDHARVCQLLRRLASSSEPVVRESAQWALSRIQ